MKDEKWFWSIIEQSQKGRDLAKIIRKVSHEQQLENLTNILSSLSASDIHDFQVNFQQLLNKSYTWRLWGAAYIINDGCSDDTFDYFRSWLIGRGKTAYYNALKDAESLKDIIKPSQVEDMEWEGLEYCAVEAYENSTGKELELIGELEHPAEPVGDKWNDADLPSMFPALWKKFSRNRDSEDAATPSGSDHPAVLSATFDGESIPRPGYWINELNKKNRDAVFRLLGDKPLNHEKMNQEEYVGYFLQLRSQIDRDSMGILVQELKIHNGRVKVEFQNFEEKLTGLYTDLSLVLSDLPNVIIRSAGVDYTSQQWKEYVAKNA